jgi:hypothetical protein
MDGRRLAIQTLSCGGVSARLHFEYGYGPDIPLSGSPTEVRLPATVH